jgi:hypothetical protein
VLRRELLQEPTSRAWPVADYARTAAEVLLRGILLDADTPPPATPVAVPAAPRQAKRIMLEDA